MTLRLGTLDVVDVRYGATAVARVLLGTVQVWPTAPSVVTGAVAAVETPDVAILVGTVTAPVPPVTGVVATVETTDLVDILASFTPLGVIGGVIDVTEIDDLAAIVGTLTAPVYTGAVLVVEGEDLAAIVGSSTAPIYTGTIVATEDDDLATVVGTSTAPIYSGTIGVVEDDDVAAIVGTFVALAITGAVLVTEDADVSVIVGTSIEFVGVVATTEETDASVIVGSFGPTGAVAITEDADVSVIAGTFTASTFPTIATVNNEIGTSMGAQAINMPTGTTAGDLLIAIAANDNPSTTVMTASAGWTEIRQQVQGANVMRLAAFGRIADGTATDNITITGAAQDYVAFTARITGHGLGGISGIFAADANAATGNGDPPSLATDSDRGWLWLAAEGVDLTTGNTITSVPSGYTSQFNNVSASSTSSVALAVGSRTAAGVTTENPATFTNNPTTRPWVAFTIGIPASAPATITGTVVVTEADDASLIVGTSGAGGGVSFADTFNRADTTHPAASGTGLGSEWFGPSYLITGNRAQRTGVAPNGGDYAVFNHDVGSNDMWVEADCDPTGAVFSVVNVRRATATDDAMNGVGYLGYYDVSGPNTYVIAKTTPSFASIATGGSGGGVKKLRLEVEGTALRLYVDNVLTVSTTDASITTGHYAGLNGNSNATFDNFRCGALPWSP